MIGLFQLFHFPSVPVLLGTAGSLAVWLFFGLFLVPRSAGGGSAMSLLALRLVSGMLFSASILACVLLQKACYLAAIPLAQMAAVIVWRMAARRAASPGKQDTPWPLREAAIVAGITAGFMALFSAQTSVSLDGGRLVDLRGDTGYFIQQVMGLPEARVANFWAGALGEHAAEADSPQDVWYHWIPMLLASGVHLATGLPAITALLEVTDLAANAVLVLVAGAIVQFLARLPAAHSVFIGGLSLVCGQFMRTEAWIEWLNSVSPYGLHHHLRTSLVQWLAYKHEAAVLLGALAAWLGGSRSMAGLLLFCSAVSAPHGVAAIGASAVAMAGFGILLRNPRMWKTALAMTGILLAGWGTVLALFQARMAKAEGQSFASFGLDDILQAAGRGTVDALVGLIIGALSLPGIIHLARSRANADMPARLVGWLALSGMVASYGAYHFLKNTADSFHVISFMQTVIIMPAGMWGAARMAARHSGGPRLAAIALAAATAAVGLAEFAARPAALLPALWRESDVAAARGALDGRPFGYFAKEDRGWWISKHGVLGGLLDSRCVRLNPLKNEQSVRSSQFYGFSAPLDLLPPRPGETTANWSLRFAERLGIRHVLETAQDPIPAAIKARCRPLVFTAGIWLYELPPPAASEARLLPQPAAQKP